MVMAMAANPFEAHQAGELQLANAGERHRAGLGVSAQTTEPARLPAASSMTDRGPGRATLSNHSRAVVGSLMPTHCLLN